MSKKKMTEYLFIPIEPIAKPRMTQRDSWKKRPCVVKYWRYCDELKVHNIELPENYHIFFFLGMPKSWSKKKKAKYHLKPHTQKPDKDNLEKGFLDAIFKHKEKDDAEVWTGTCSKYHSYEPLIVIKKEKVQEIPEKIVEYIDNNKSI